MPAVSASQRRAAGAALAAKRAGKSPKGKGPVAQMAKGMSEAQLADFARKKKKGKKKRG